MSETVPLSRDTSSGRRSARRLELLQTCPQPLYRRQTLHEGDRLLTAIESLLRLFGSAGFRRQQHDVLLTVSHGGDRTP